MTSCLLTLSLPRVMRPLVTISARGEKEQERMCTREYCHISANFSHILRAHAGIPHIALCGNEGHIFCQATRQKLIHGSRNSFRVSWCRGFLRHAKKISNFARFRSLFASGSTAVYINCHPFLTSFSMNLKLRIRTYSHTYSQNSTCWKHLLR